MKVAIFLPEIFALLLLRPGNARKHAGSRKINVLVACGQTCKTVPKISSIYYFAPGAHTEGDGYLYQNRQLSDTFVFPNGKDGKVDSVFVDVDPAEEIAE